MKFDPATVFNPFACYDYRSSVYDLDHNHEWILMNQNDHGILQIACWQSHLQVYFRIAHRNPAKPTLILEDDIDIPPSFGLDIKTYLRNLPSDWDMFFPGFRDYPRTAATKNGFAQLKFVVETHAYIIRNATAARKLIMVANTFNPQIADRVWQNAIYSGDIIAYIPDNAIPLIRQNKKTYGSTFTGNWN